MFCHLAGLINCHFTGLNAQNETAAQAAAAAAGLLPTLPSVNIQNLAALAAMAQPALSAATQQPSAQLSNAAALLCKSKFISFTLSDLYILYLYIYLYCLVPFIEKSFPIFFS